MILRHRPSSRRPDPASPRVPVLEVDSCDSTMRLAVEPAALAEALGTEESELPDPPYLIATSDQRAGRGRQGRSWVDQPGRSLAMTLVWEPRAPREMWGWYSLGAALAVQDACALLASEGRDGGEGGVGAPVVPLEVKWPNDLLLADGRKVAGILASANGDRVGVGIGINLVGPVEAGPLGRQEPGLERAAALSTAGEPWASIVRGEDGRRRLSHHVASSLAATFATMESGEAGRAELRERYTVTCLTVGAKVVVDGGGGEEHAEATGLDVDNYGHLRIRCADGAERTVTAQDVHLLPTGLHDFETQRPDFGAKGPAA